MSHDDLIDHAAAFDPMSADSYVFAADARMLRDSIVQMIQGDIDEPIYAVSRYIVTTEPDGRVELILGIRECTTDPHRYVRVRIERVDN